MQQLVGHSGESGQLALHRVVDKAVNCVLVSAMEARQHSVLELMQSNNLVEM